MQKEEGHFSPDVLRLGYIATNVTIFKVGFVSLFILYGGIKL